MSELFAIVKLTNKSKIKNFFKCHLENFMNLTGPSDASWVPQLTQNFLLLSLQYF